LVLLRHPEQVGDGEHREGHPELVDQLDLTARIGDAEVDLHREVLTSIGLPVSYRGAWPALSEAMLVDKKARGSRLRFVILDAIGSPIFLDGPDPTLLVAAYGEISA